MHVGRFGIKRYIAEAVTSEEADRVTPDICAIFLRLVTAPKQWWLENEVLSVRSVSQDCVLTPAWSVLVAYLQVPSETARRALAWFEEKGFISLNISADGREVRISFEGLYFPEDKPQG
jgi:hypothetical protein